MNRFTTSDGLSLSYLDEGTGLPLLCLAGLTRNTADFDDLAAGLDRPVRLIRLNARGRASSDHAPDPMSYTIPIEARDALELLDHLGLAKAVIIGTSRGGLIAMLLAATAKDRLAGVLLNDIGPVTGDVGMQRILDYVGIPPQAGNYVELARLLRRNLGEDFPDISESRWAVYAERWFRETPGGIALRYDPRLREAVLAQAAAAPPDIWPLFDALDGLPLAMLRGENSNLLTPETFKAMQTRRPDAGAAEVRNRGHVPFLNEPESLATIHALIDRVTQSETAQTVGAG